MKKWFYISLLFGLSFIASPAQAVCTGQFYNPLTDICWSCLFPIEIAGKSFDFNQVDTTISSESLPQSSCDPSGVTCRCGDKCGIPFSFYEPARHYDVTKTPGCFPGIGVEVNMSDLPGGSTGTQVRTGGKPRVRSFNHVNVYVDPLLYWLDVMTDNPCIEQKGFDVLYFTPADICWDDESTCSFLNPEAYLFGNMASVLACSADCVLETGAQYRNEMTDIEKAAIRSTYWCVGCNGPTFPLSGHREYTPGGDIADTQTLGQRIFTKLHRELLVWGTSGAAGLCGYYPKPMMDKLDYKNQMLFPKPETDKINGHCCQMFGSTTALWGAGKSWPITGEDYSFMVYRRRDCCIGQVSVGDMIGGL